MRRICAAAITLTAIVVAACSGDRTPTAPTSLAVALANSIATEGCVDRSLTLFRTPETPADELTVDEEVKLLIAGSPTFGPGLYIEDNRQSALSMWENIKNDKLLSRPLQSHIDNETKFTLNQLGIGGIQDPDGAGSFTAVTGSIRVLDLIFRCTGTRPTTVPEPPDGFNAEWAIVRQSFEIQEFRTNGGNAGVFFEGDAVPDGTLLVLVGEQTEDVQVNSPFPKLSKTIDFALAGGTPTKKLSILVCKEPLASDEASHRGVIAHQKTARQTGDGPGAGVEYLPPAEIDRLACTVDVGSNWRMEKGFLRQRLAQLGSYAQKAWSFIGPKPLYAGHAAIGGSSDFIGGFSPLVAVDPYVETEITDVVIPETTYGQAINFTATLRVKAGPESWIGQPVTASLPGMPTPLTLDSLRITVTLSDGKTQTDTINADGVAEFSFSRVNAGDHLADLDFPETLNLPANAPLFGASSLLDVPFRVNQAPLDVIPAAASKTYGDVNPALTGDVQGEQYDEDSKIVATYTTTATQQSFISTAERTYPITVVSIAPAEGSGVLLSNYVYDLAEHSAFLTINTRTLAGNAAAASRVYGDPNPEFGGVITNPVSLSDGLVVTYTNSSIATTSVGPSTSPTPEAYLIEAVLSGPPLENYVNGITDGVLTITPRPLTGVIDDKSKQQGAVNPGLTGTVNGFVPGDGAIGTVTTTALTDSPIGSYPITLVVNSANYVWQGTDGVLTVVARQDVTGAGTATIDGTLGTGEWDNARTFAVTANLPGDGTTPATLYVMNDGANIYYAIRFQRAGVNLNSTNLFNIEIDTDQSGNASVGDDYLTTFVSSEFPTGTLSDNHRSAAGVQTDITHGSGAFRNADGVSVYEFSHPLNSDETGKDVALSPGTATSFLMVLQIDGAVTSFPGAPSNYQPLTIVETP